MFGTLVFKKLWVYARTTSLCNDVCPFKQPYTKFALIPAKPDGLTLTFASCSTARLLSLMKP